MPPFAEIFVAATMILGTFLILVAGIGLVRFPDVFCRMHAAGKAGTLGTALVILSTVIMFESMDLAHNYSILIRGVLAIVFQFMTTPTATHLLARAAYITNYPLTDRTRVDELKGMLPSEEDATFGHE